MRWIYSTNVGSVSPSFPRAVLEGKLSEKPQEAIDIAMNFYPTDGELGMLASIVYEEHRAFPNPHTSLSRADKLRLEGELLDAQQARVPPQLNHFFQRWSCVFRFLEQDSGYSGAIYIHESLPQIVIVNEGTRTTEHMAADVREPGSLTVGEATEVSAAVDLMTQLYRVLNAFPHYAVSITGHSLGGWLSLVSTLEAEKLMHVHTVTFDSPGAMPMLLKRQFEVSSSIGIGTLDIKTILSNVNLVNVCHTHAPGTVRVFLPLQDITGSKDYLLAAHDMLRMLEQFDEQGNLPITHYRTVDNWPSVKPPIQDIKTHASSLVFLQGMYRAAKTAMGGGFSEYHAFFDYCKRHDIQYDYPDEWLDILDQGQCDALAYGSAHYATSEANATQQRFACLTEKEKRFFLFLFNVHSIIPELHTWFIARGFSNLFQSMRHVQFDERHVFKVTGEGDPQIVLRSTRSSSSSASDIYSLDVFINDIRQLIRRYPNAVADIQTEFHHFLQETRHKAEAALAAQRDLPVQIRAMVEEKLNQLLPGIKAEARPAVITHVKTAMFARRDAYDEEEVYEFSSDEALRQARMDALRLKEEFKQKGGEEAEAPATLSDTGLSIDDFQQFITQVTENKNVDRLIVGMRDAYSRRTQLMVRNSQPQSEGKGPNP